MISGNKVKSRTEHVQNHLENRNQNTDGIHEPFHPFLMGSNRSDVLSARMFAQLCLTGDSSVVV